MCPPAPLSADNADLTLGRSASVFLWVLGGWLAIAAAAGPLYPRSCLKASFVPFDPDAPKPTSAIVDTDAATFPRLMTSRLT